MKIDYTGVESIYTNLNVVVDEMRDIVKAWKQEVSKLDKGGYWDSAGYDAYNKKFNDFANNFIAFFDDVYSANNELLEAVKRYKKVDEATKGWFG